MSKRIQAIDVDVFYGKFKAVEGVNIDIAPRSVTAFIGPSGCGKTTTMKMINRIIEPTTGRIMIGGEDVTGVDAVRLTMVFASPPEDDVDWADVAPGAAGKFLARAWRLARDVRATGTPAGTDPADGAVTLRRVTHRTVHEAQQLLDDGKFNVVVAKTMELVNAARKEIDAGAGAADPAAAAASLDGKVTAKILGTLSTEKIGAGAAERLEGLLHSRDPEVRRSAALALGGVPAERMAGTRESLLSQYRTERDPSVRKALLSGIAQLGFSSAVPELQKLRGLEPALTPEIDAWIRVLQMDLQEWNLILREKQRLQQVP